MKKVKDVYNQLEKGITISLPRNIYFSLKIPKSYEKDYDQAISMLEMCSESIIEISWDDYGKYVMDRWDWKEEFEESVSNYKSMSRK